MPVGIASCALKTSFSLTSLRPGTPTESPDHNARLRVKTERLYHSLTKNSRKSSQLDKEQWRKSWGSGISYDDKQFWEEFQADYDYLMSQNMLEGEMTEIGLVKDSPTAPLVWSHSEFLDQFAQLYSWLKGIQDSVYSKQENVTDWKLRAERQEELQRQRFRLGNFNEESKKLAERWPELDEEITWRVKYVNEKWETVEAMMGSLRNDGSEVGKEDESNERAEHEVKCLRKWIREMETKLKPLTFQLGWTKTELEKKRKEHLVLQRDIKAHGKIVSSVVKLCEKTETYSSAAHALERKYHELYLRSIEWQCHIESLIVDLQSNKSQPSVNNDSDGEPAAKLPRFSCDNYDLVPNKLSDGNIAENDWLMDTSSPLDTYEEVKSIAKMVGTNAKRRHDGQIREITESILRIEESASAQTLSKSSMLGTESRNANIFISYANRETEYTANLVESLKFSIPAGLSDESQCHGIKESSILRDISTTVIESELNRTERKSPNTGTFTYKHLDTDSDQEIHAMSEEKLILDEKNGKEDVDLKETESTSSDESWRYVVPENEAKELTETSDGTIGRNKPNAAVRLDFGEMNASKVTSNNREMKYFSANNIPRSNWSKRQSSKESIKELVDRADEMVRCKNAKSEAKNARIKRWLKQGDDLKVLDSCDASGECTEESDDKESQSSDDYDGSVATCRPSGSAEGILDETPNSKFELILRNNRRQIARNRPWSISGLSGLKNQRVQSSKAHLSVSESALNQMQSPFGKDKLKDFSSTPSGKESRGLFSELGSGSLRRRKTKVRKRTTNRKSESGSDGVTMSGSDWQQTRSSPNKHLTSIRGLVKSGSFSGVMRKQSDSSVGTRKCCNSGTETEEDVQKLKLPEFRLGPEAGAVTISNGGKVNGEEQLSLNSDLVDWDNYQEKYQSEAYSEEPPDSDAAKKLLEFGEDYGKYLDSQSESSLGYCTSNRRRSKSDSDSDVDELRELLRKSQDQLEYSEKVFNKFPYSGDLPLSTEFIDELVATCKRNQECLVAFLDNVRVGVLPVKERKDIENLLERWKNLKTRTELQKAKQLHKDMATLKDELTLLESKISAMETSVSTRDELETKISQVKGELNSIRERKCKLLESNVTVHKFLFDTGHPASILEDDVIDLYQIWDKTFETASSQLCNLQRLSQPWLEIEDHLSQLECALRSDQDTLKMIDSALRRGIPTTDVAVSVRDVARVLSEKEAVTKGPLVMDDSVTASNPPSVLTTLNTEGSLSDSGISDSGSEQELSEREKRLARVKRLARHLESILAPGSQALVNIYKRIEQAEAELRGLQKTCRDLIVRSAPSNEIRISMKKPASSPSPIGANVLSPKSPHGKRRKSQVSNQRFQGSGSNGSGGEPDDEPNKSGKKSWFWRVIRSALPFQLALVALLCVACLLEPYCCDALNNLGMSLSPQLRYDRGPPPV